MSLGINNLDRFPRVKAFYPRYGDIPQRRLRSGTILPPTLAARDSFVEERSAGSLSTLSTPPLTDGPKSVT